MDNKGTIVYIGGFELPDRNAAAHRVLANGKIMRDLGYEVVFVGVDKNRPKGVELLRQDFFGFECWSVPYPATWVAWLKYILGLTEIIHFLQRDRTCKVVGVICYNYPAVAQLRIKLQGQIRKLKIITDVTEWYDACSISFVHKVIKLLDTALRMHVVNKLADGIITTSKYMTNFYKSTGKPIVELPTLFDTYSLAAPNRKNTSMKNFIYVGSPFDVGRVNKARNNIKERLDVCIDIFYKIYKAGGNFSFQVYGISSEDYLRVFPEHSGMLKEMSRCTVFMGRQPNQLVLLRIAECDFSIFFRDEIRVTLAGFPSKLAESISCGTPVISNKMMSLENYERSEGLFLAEKGGELDIVKQVIGLSSAEINDLKNLTYCSRTFDYRHYKEKFSLFLTDLEL